MKNFIAYLVALIAALGLYAQTYRVVELNEQTDTVTVESATGYLYAFYGCEDWQIGDLAAILMWTNGTNEITDDVILSVRYAGRFE